MQALGDTSAVFPAKLQYTRPEFADSHNVLCRKIRASVGRGLPRVDTSIPLAIRTRYRTSSQYSVQNAEDVGTRANGEIIEECIFENLISVELGECVQRGHPGRP
jgi:hypothetical protein